MKTPVFSLFITGLILAASVAHAAQPSELQGYTDRAQAHAQRLLSTAGLDGRTVSVSIRATVDPDGRLSGVQVMRSSGSRSIDIAAETVLRKMIATDPPVGLTDGVVILKVSEAPIAQAKAP